MKEAHKRNKEQEKGEYKNVSGALLSQGKKGFKKAVCRILK